MRKKNICRCKYPMPNDKNVCTSCGRNFVFGTRKTVEINKLPSQEVCEWHKTKYPNEVTISCAGGSYPYIHLSFIFCPYCGLKIEWEGDGK